ncbi:MAG: 5,5-dehydrodivanillate O-demethylase oxygenase subunit [Chloroflexota bacterium]|jgi:5,5'-dehydrodivanillate O-demethylase|nr:5,5-dehydrodivanillate O-demethylase oxygenase subunit [Chloroflexota bacterium]
MLTAAQNEMLTRVGPGTAMGELLRRYWFPVAMAPELTDEQPTKFVRILGEDLVLFKDKSGNVGLIQDHCAHRGASLLYGRVEERGIACAYHGWLYDTAGSCLECPAEPADSMFHLTVKMQAYPVQDFVGMYWAYLGPLPAPVIPKYDLWARQDGTRRLYVQPRLDCNFLQPMENSVDPAHLQILHQDSIGNRQRQHLANLPTNRRVAPSTTRGFTDDVESFDFIEVPYGIMKRRVFKTGRVDEHPLIFPNILRVGNATQIRVPVDDTHTQVFIVHFDPTEDGSVPEPQSQPPVTYIEPYKTPMTALHPIAHFRMDETQAQDHMAWETQGPIVDRSVERLATTDRGIVMLRQMYLREIERMQRGEDPKSVLRDPDHAIIDTNLTDTIRLMWERASI